jgi:polysaccharide biosynthesis/export protein
MRFQLPTINMNLVMRTVFLFFALSMVFGADLGTETVLNEAEPVLGASQQSSMDALDQQHKLAPGDRLSYRVIEDKDPTKALMVTDSGELDVPYLGRMRVAGKTCYAVAREIKTDLEKDLYYQATVIVAVDQFNKKRGSVYLVGQVRQAGSVDIPSDEVFTLSKAILHAGGFADFADKKRVKVTREPIKPGAEPRSFVVDVAAIFERGRTDTDLVLAPGDLIFVPSRAFNF